MAVNGVESLMRKFNELGTMEPVVNSGKLHYEAGDPGHQYIHWNHRSGAWMAY